ncbi:hypothetical protein OROMI_009825 [Orobanche minor]
MEDQLDLQSFSVVWRGRNIVVEMNLGATLKELGDKLQELTHVEPDTLRLLVPVGKNSKLLYPFSEEHSHMNLESASILKGKSIRMMGVLKDEVDEVLKNAKVDLRIAGFDEEERRLKQRISGRSYAPKLPQGTYIFCDFRTLSLPGIVLNPPASKALELLHKLASDPGIVAIMNKHRWRVGILTEMAPEGYVGVSPKCILGFNKNHGEEISLRLRTDDLKGFRKYEKIKKTLLHELAHMVFSEHDSNFLALDSQLNKEAATLDWTKSRGHTLSGGAASDQYDEEFDLSSNVITSHKLGGRVSVLPTARAASANAALARLADSSPPHDCDGDECMKLEPCTGSGQDHLEPARDDQSNPNTSGISPVEPNLNGDFEKRLALLEPELDHAEADTNHPRDQNPDPSDQMDLNSFPIKELPSDVSANSGEAHASDSHVDEMQTEPDSGGLPPTSHSAEPVPDDPELQIIQDPVTVFCGRLQSAVQSLRNEATPSDTERVLQTIVKIISNVMEHPNEVKFRKLRKANPLIQKKIVNYKAAMEILKLIGFHEEAVVVESGNTEPYFVLKRNDPGLLWLAKSSLETCIS